MTWVSGLLHFVEARSGRARSRGKPRPPSVFTDIEVLRIRKEYAKLPWGKKRQFLKRIAAEKHCSMESVRNMVLYRTRSNPDKALDPDLTP